MDEFKKLIREVPDFPKPGILFYDITTLLGDAEGFRLTVDSLAAPYRDQAIDVVVGIESRGFILGAAVAHALKAGFVPIRKPGKLPSKALKESYALEYGAYRTRSTCRHKSLLSRRDQVEQNALCSLLVFP